MTFSGSVNISIDLARAADEIVLHALDLDIERVLLVQEGTESTPSVTIDEERQWITLSTDHRVESGRAEIQVDYSARYCENLVGLYTSEFDHDGTTHRLAVTQCESTHARRILPCFDEPEFKASFEVSLDVPTGLTAVSNGGELERSTSDDGQTDSIRFAPTIEMSTYLLAVVVGPLEVTEAPDIEGRDGPISLRIVHPPGQGHLTGFAVDVATHAIRFFEDYYALAYPGEKVDLVAIPDFAFGAMENLGCITFREVLLLVDPETAAPMELQRVADVINHELAHMWFGDLVTMRWWNGIWLNEAFATFMEILASDDFRPEWDVWTTFGLARSAAFDTDALDSTRPIEYEVVTAADSEDMFDILTYEKGASVLRMLEQYLGADRFRDGIRSYLRQHAYSNTDTSDLWKALEAATGEPVERIAEAWIFRGGHPLVMVDPAADGSRVRLSQQPARFRKPLAAEVAPEPFPVPMTVITRSTTGNDEEHRLLLEDNVELSLDEPAQLVRTNPSGNGFFRTLLPRVERRALLASVEPPLERYVVLDDTWFAVVAGRSGPGAVIDTISDLVDLGETDPSIWRRVASVLGELKALLSVAQRTEFRQWVRSELRGQMDRLPPLSSRGRKAEAAAPLLAVLGVLGEDEDAIAVATGVFDGEHADVDPAVLAGALDVVAHDPTDEQYEEIRRRWSEASTPQDEQRHLAALVATERPDQFQRGLEECLGDVRPQDAPYVLRRALANTARGTDAWDFVVNNFEDISMRLPSGALPRMFAGVRSFTDEWTALAVERFLEANPLPTGAQQIAQHIERMRANVAAATRIREYPAEFWGSLGT